MYVDFQEIKRINESIDTFTQIRDQLFEEIPAEWKSEREKFVNLNKATRSARQKYRRNSDSAYEPLMQLSRIMEQTPMLLELENQLKSVKSIVENNEPENAMKMIKEIEKNLGEIAGSSPIKSKISKARRALKGKKPNPEKALQQWEEGMTVFYQEVEWRKRASQELSKPLEDYKLFLSDSIGLRLQKKLNKEQALSVSACKSSHEDISLFF